VNDIRMNGLPLPLCLLTLCVLSGCGLAQNDLKGSAQSAPAATDASPQQFDQEIKLEHDVGIIDGDAEYNFEVPWTGSRSVESVSKGCGCTAANVAVGDSLGTGATIKMQVSTTGKTSGKGGQSLLIKFADGGTCQCVLKYDYRQPPFVSPKYLIFRPNQPTRDIELAFPGAVKPELVAIEENDEFLTAEVQPATAGTPDKILVKLTYDYSRNSDAKERFVVFKARSSSREHTLRLSYLALHKD